MNLLKETIEALKENGKTPQDVKWCGSVSFGSFNWDTFKSIANVKYDAGYGAPEVAQDLVIVGKDFWLERHEYDGAESWHYKVTPVKPKLVKPLALTVGQANKLGFGVSCGWQDLNEINGKKSLN